MKKLLFLLVFIPLLSFTQTPSGKAYQVYSLINEARTNPELFLNNYKTKIVEYEPKFIEILEKSIPIKKVIWDENLAINCKQRVYGNLNPEYEGVNEMCGNSTGYGKGFDNEIALHFLCDSYTHIMDEDDAYFGFYIDSKGHTIMWGKSCERKKYFFEFNQIIDSSKIDFKRIKTGAKELDINAMDKEMIKEINFVRQYPKVYASIIANYLSDESKSWRGLKKDEYEAGVELIEELKLMSPSQLLYPKKCVYEAAKKHAEDCKNRGFTDHTGSDGSSPFSRVSSYCDGLEGNENIVGGTKNARILVIQLLIDSGISSRGHRYNMLNPSWKYIGCYGYEGEKMYNYIQNFAKDSTKP
tara:strand:+ start:129 stop:1196 length:1068 start_codon:yes stop_codon:yes gene_type:complete